MKSDIDNRMTNYHVFQRWNISAIKLKCRHKNSAIHSDSIKFCHCMAAIVFYFLLFSLPQSWSEWEMRGSEQSINFKLPPCSVLDPSHTIPSVSLFPNEQGSSVGVFQCPWTWSLRALWWFFPIVSLKGIMVCLFPSPGNTKIPPNRCADAEQSWQPAALSLGSIASSDCLWVTTDTK